MKLEQLQEFFPVERHADLADLFQRYCEGAADTDVDGFVSHLHAQGVLSTDTMQEVLTLHEVALSSVPEGAGLPHSRHRLVAHLGKGAMGEVFIARDPSLQRTVAVKRIDPKLLKKPAALQRFYAEAQITAQLDHPGIVPIYGLETDDEGRLSYAMKFVRGKTLTEYIADARATVARGEGLDDDHTLTARIETFLPILNAISYAHRRGVLHRDLKPDNIMVGSFGEVLVMDWGIARPIGKRERVTSTVSGIVEKTRSGSLVGTPSYMSPEQATGATETLGAASDQYSLGLVLYELVALRRAVTAETPFEVVAMAASGIKAPLTHSDSREPVPRELRAIIDTATARRPEDRYASLDAFADDLRRYLRDESVHADPDGLLRRVKRWVGRHRGLAMALVAGLLVMATAVIVLVQVLERASARKREQQLQTVASIVDAQSLEMNVGLARYEAMLQGIVSATETVMSYPAPDAKELVIYQYKRGRRYPAERPEYAIPSKVYGRAVSFRYPDVSAPADADPQALRPRAQQLWQLAGSLRRLLLESHSQAAMALPFGEAEKLVLEQGTPLVWTYVASREGVLVAMPGSWDDEAVTDPTNTSDYDVRKGAWYRLALERRGPVWSTVADDITPTGRAITCVQAVYSDDDTLLGVAGLDMTFGYFIDHLLENPLLADAGAESLIIDHEGLVVVRSTQKEAARDARRYRPLTYEETAVLEALRMAHSGHLELADGRLALWSRLHGVPWTYLVIGDARALMEAPPVQWTEP